MTTRGSESRLSPAGRAQISKYQREKEDHFYKLLRNNGCSTQEIEDYRRSEILRRAVDNVHRDSEAVRASASPKRTMQAKSKVAQNLRSQKKGRKNAKLVASMKANDEAIFQAAMGNERMSISPSNKGTMRMTVADNYSAGSKSRSPKREDSPYVSEIQARIAAKEAELQQLHDQLNNSKWRSSQKYNGNATATTKGNTMGYSESPMASLPSGVAHREPTSINVATTSYSANCHKRGASKTLDEATEQAEQEMEEFKSFEE